MPHTYTYSILSWEYFVVWMSILIITETLREPNNLLDIIEVSIFKVLPWSLTRLKDLFLGINPTNLYHCHEQAPWKTARSSWSPRTFQTDVRKGGIVLPPSSKGRGRWTRVYWQAGVVTQAQTNVVMLGQSDFLRHLQIHLQRKVRQWLLQTKDKKH